MYKFHVDLRADGLGTPSNQFDTRGTTHHEEMGTRYLKFGTFVHAREVARPLEP